MDQASDVGWGGLAPAALYAEAGVSAHEAGVGGVGLRWPWTWQGAAGGGRLSVATELSLSRWSAPVRSGRERTTQVALMPMLRWQAQGGASAWFVEGGIGLSFHDRHYRAGPVYQSTQWNFQEAVAIGRRVGPSHELSLRLAHFSNAGLRKPNPGENRLTLRWSAAF